MGANAFTSSGKNVPVEMFEASGSGPHPAVVVVYGTRGMNAPFGESIRAFAKKLAAAGIPGLIPHYFEVSGTTASTDGAGDAVVMEQVDASLDKWVQAVADCLTFAGGRPAARPDRLALLGFSLGGHVMLRAAKRPSGPVVRAAVSSLPRLASGPSRMESAATWPSCRRCKSTMAKTMGSVPARADEGVGGSASERRQGERPRLRSFQLLETGTRILWGRRDSIREANRRLPYGQARLTARRPLGSWCLFIAATC